MGDLFGPDVDEALNGLGSVLDQLLPLCSAVRGRLLARVDDKRVLNLLNGLLLGSVSQKSIDRLGCILKKGISFRNGLKSLLGPNSN